MAAKGIVVHTIGIGTSQGVRFVGHNNKVLMSNGKPVISKLDEDRMQEISKLGKGSYFLSHYSDRNAIAINDILSKQNEQFLESQHTTQHWEERFYIFILPILLIIIFWFRRGFIFPFILAIILLPTTSHAGNNLSELPSRILLNEQNFAKKLVEEYNSPEEALNYLEDPYRRGVAYYRSKDYVKAEQEFEKNKRAAVAKESLYNLGNSLAMQYKLHEAVDAYKSAIALDKDYEDAKYNLAIIEKMLEEEEQDKDEDEQDQEQEDKDEQQDEQEDSGDLKKSNGSADDDNNKEGDDQKSDGQNDKQQNDSKNDDENSQDDQADNKSEKNSDPENDTKDNDQDQSNDNTQNGDENPHGQNEDDNKTGENIDIGEWLNRISDDHKNFLRNQFYLESQRQMKLEKLDDNLDPW